MFKLFYDLETTGLPAAKGTPLNHPDQPRIVQIGAILDNEEGKEVSRLNVIIAQAQPIPERAMESHKISMEYSQQVGVSESAAVELLLDLIDVADVVIGFNHKNFDNNVVIGTARRIVENEAFDPFAGKALFDVMVAGKPIAKLRHAQGGYRNPKLVDLHKIMMGEEFGDAHQAIADVLATRRCYYKMQEMLNPAAKAQG